MLYEKLMNFMYKQNFNERNSEIEEVLCHLIIKTVHKPNIEDNNVLNSEIIKDCINNVYWPKNQISAIDNLCKHFPDNYEQVVHFIDSKFLIFLSDNLFSIIAPYKILTILCYAFQLSSKIDDIQVFLEHFLKSSFLQNLLLIIESSSEEETQILGIECLVFLSQINEDVRINMLEIRLFESMNKFIYLNEKIKIAVSFFYSKITNFSYGYLTVELNQQVLPALLGICQNANETALRYAFKSFRHLMIHSPIAFEVIHSNGMVGFICNCMNSRDAKCRLQSAKLLRSCIQFDDFPFDSLFGETNEIGQIFNALQWKDNELTDVLTSIFKSLIVCNVYSLQSIVQFISKFDIFEHFGGQSFEMKTKLLSLIKHMIESSSIQQAQSLLNEQAILFLCDFLVASDVDIVFEISSLLHYILSNSEMDFRVTLVQIFIDSGACETVASILEGPEISQSLRSVLGALLTISTNIDN